MCDARSNSFGGTRAEMCIYVRADVGVNWGKARMVAQLRFVGSIGGLNNIDIGSMKRINIIS